ncbi:hypothetical protein C8Q75DRAFT_719833 [Abortiporus biennis]|nr:hypothetical protein C8Q75DRAFT_719833 [Abortiporus biennis]
MLDLPVEIWVIIFDLALDEPSDHVPIFEPTSFAESSWFKAPNSTGWALRSSQDLLSSSLRERYSLLKAISSTCRVWRQIAAEYLFKVLYFDDPSALQKLCAALDNDRRLGKWARRIHITRYYAPGGHTPSHMQDVLVSIIRHCRKLESFVVDWPVGLSFLPIVDALCTYCPRTLQTLHLNVPSECISGVIWALDSLSSLVSIHIEFSGKVNEGVHLGAASGLELTFPSVKQLSLRGFFADFVEEAISWHFPCLDTLSLDYLSYRDDFPDIMEFLHNHGENLTYLDIDCIPILDVAGILDLCPNLVTFAFNPDWRLPVNDLSQASTLVRSPHRNIQTIGCHQLLHAFGVGIAATRVIDPYTSNFYRRSNDLNFAALNKSNFPKLQSIRILNRSLLRDLEASNGPDEVCYERWERWWKQCASQGVKLQDCTGADLGNLPEVDDVTSEYEPEDEPEEVPATNYSTGSHLYANDTLTIIRDLLQECRRFHTGTSGYTYGMAHAQQGY